MVRPSPLTFDCSHPEAADLFRWASRQALAYAFDGDPVGPWYEAALPGRDAFCMRDVCHQALGAHALGLGEHTLNMVRRFAVSCTEARDWCCLWEIDRNGLPPATDYRNDDEFWFCLPASFDLLDTCARMLAWSGDTRYHEDPALLEHHRRTVYDHVERWDLDVARIMKRARILNTRRAPTSSRLVAPRGIPGYDEGDPGFTVGLDLLATLHAGYLGYAAIQTARGAVVEAALFRRRAREMAELVERTWWDPRVGSFFDCTDAGGTPVHAGGGSTAAALYWRLTDDPRKLEALAARLETEAPTLPAESVEPLSHVPEILYRHGRPEAAFRELARLAASPRRAYPEVSFAAVGAITTGLMGIEPGSPSGEGTPVLDTLPRLPGGTGWARLAHLAYRGNTITVTHTGPGSTALTNEAGPALLWRPRFAGEAEDPRVLVVGAGETVSAEA